MRSLTIIAVAVIAALLTATTVSAQCSVSGSACGLTSQVVPATTVCDSAWWSNAQQNLPQDWTQSTFRSRYLACWSSNASPGSDGNNRCCPDPCSAYSGTETCTERNCAALPTIASGASEGKVDCVSRDKLCGLLSVGSGSGSATNNQCGLYSFCFNKGGVCSYQSPTSGAAGVATLAPGEDVSSKCAALHPMVIAMLALMFVTLVGGIVLVGVVVVINQRKADAEDAEKGRRDM